LFAELHRRITWKYAAVSDLSHPVGDIRGQNVRCHINYRESLAMSGPSLNLFTGHDVCVCTRIARFQCVWLSATSSIRAELNCLYGTYMAVERNHDVPLIKLLFTLGQWLLERVRTDCSPWLREKATGNAAEEKDVSGTHRYLKVGHDPLHSNGC